MQLHEFFSLILSTYHEQEKNNVTAVGDFLQVSKGSILEPHIAWMAETADEILTERQNSYK